MKNLLIRLGACEELREWVGDRTLDQAWAECERPDWMLWLHSRSDSSNGHAYAALAKTWEAEAEADAAAAEAAWAAAAWAEAAAEAAAAEADAAEADAAEAARKAAEAWAAAEEAAAAARVRQCEDIRAALCCPVFEDNK